MNGLSVLLTLVLFLLANQVAFELRRAGVLSSAISAQNSGSPTNLIIARHSSPRPVTLFLR